MILTCPNCGTQYVVKDGAIPPQGRQVRCASCKHSWHQGPDESEPEAVADPMAAGEPDLEPESEHESLAEATLIEPRTGPEAEQRAYEEALVEGEDANVEFASGMDPVADQDAAGLPALEPTAAPPVPVEAGAGAASPYEFTDWNEPPTAEAQDDEFSPFPERDTAGYRETSPILKVILVVLIVAIAAAAFWFLAPTAWKARVGLASTGDTPLQLMMTHSDRQKLASGNELLAVTGRVINPTNDSQPVPPIQAQLRSRGGQLVYSWTIAPPTRTLPPGGSATFNSAEVNVPAGGDELTITLGSAKG